MKQVIERITFSTLFDWFTGVQLLLGVFLPFPLAILASIYEVRDSWTNIGISLLFCIMLALFFFLAALVLSKNKKVQKIVLKRVSESGYTHRLEMAEVVGLFDEDTNKSIREYIHTLDEAVSYLEKENS